MRKSCVSDSGSGCFLDVDKNVKLKYIAIYEVKYLSKQRIFKQIKRIIRCLEVVTKYFDSFSMCRFDFVLYMKISQTRP